MIALIALLSGGVAFSIWVPEHRTLAKAGASMGLLAANAVRCILAGALPFTVAVFAVGNWWLLVAALVAMLVLMLVPAPWLLAVDRRKPDRALWALNREALEIVKRSRVEPLDAARLWEVLERMGQVRAPELAELRDLLTWRYLALWDPSSDLPMETLREVRIDDLERQLWPKKGAGSRLQSDEEAFLLGLHRCIGEIVARVRGGSAPPTDPMLRTLLDSLTAYRRADTEGLIGHVLAWAAAGGADEERDETADLPRIGSQTDPSRKGHGSTRRPTSEPGSPRRTFANSRLPDLGS